MIHSENVIRVILYKFASKQIFCIHMKIRNGRINEIMLNMKFPENLVSITMHT